MKSLPILLPYNTDVRLIRNMIIICPGKIHMQNVYLKKSNHCQWYMLLKSIVATSELYRLLNANALYARKSYLFHKFGARIVEKQDLKIEVKT